MLAASRHRDGPSPIAQLGLFARAAISSGTIVSRVGGSPVTGKELQQIFTAPAQRPDPPYVDTITIGEDLHLVLPPASPTTTATTAATRTYGWPTRTPWPPGDPSRPEKRSPATMQPAPASATSPLPAPGDLTVPGVITRRGLAPPRTASPLRRSPDTCLARLHTAGLKGTVTQPLRTSKPATELSSERI